MEMKFLADTCILSETSKREPDRRVVLWIAVTPYVAVPVGAWVEFEQGIAMKKDINPKRYAELCEWRDGLLASGVRFVDTDHRVASKYGQMRACRHLKTLWYPKPELEVQRGGQDLHVAAAAIVNGYCVATSNVADFLLIHEHFPLPGLYDPKTETWHVRPDPSHPSIMRP